MLHVHTTFLLVLTSEFILATIAFLLCLGKRAEKQRIALRKRAAAFNKQRSTRHSGEEFDVAYEILGKKSGREVKVRERLPY